jgi:cytochrome c biogenesis protein CcmG, thiol:disulfide interchange protein DsbE
MRLAAVLVLSVGVILGGCGSRNAPDATAPAFELKDLSGNRVSLSALKGKPVVLDFWATWCGPCRVSIPMLQAFYQKHKSEGLMVLGVNMDDDPSQVFPFVKNVGITYPVLYGGASDVGSLYGVQGLPTFVFIDKEGKVAARFEGFSREMLGAWEDVLTRIQTPPKA